MSAARDASREWRAVSPQGRAACIQALLRESLRARDDIARTVGREAGKTLFEALTTDLLPTLEMLRYLGRHAPAVLRPSRRPTPFLFAPAESRVEYRPRGVVLIIAPWNNPFQLALVPVASAIAAGNAVILKPSERTPATGELIGALHQSAGIMQGVLQVVHGGADVAEALIEAKPDMIFFTGGTAHGRSVMAAAARHLVPVILELGGKDPMIVFRDADVDRAVQAAAYAAFTHAGQHCVSVKRLCVEAPAYEGFLAKVAAETRRVAQASEWGKVQDEKTRANAHDQVVEALAQGARLITPDSPDRAGGEPTLVADATPSMRLMREETFAPVLAAMPFSDEDDAVRLANDSPYGLNASIWSGDAARCDRVVSRLESGNTFVNGALVNIGNPHLPFGGVKSSGIGRYHGPEGIRTFCAETSIMISRSKRRSDPVWFPHDEKRRRSVEQLMDLRYGDMGWFARMAGWVKLFRSM